MNTAELRAMLLNDLLEFRAGKIPASRLRASCAAVRAVCDTVKIEIAAASMLKTQMDAVVLSDGRPALSLAA